MRVATLARRHFDEVQHVTAHAIARANDMVLTETCTAEVSSDRLSCRRRQAFLDPRKRSAGTPPSTFLFLPIHLSNSPEIMAIPLPGEPGSRRSPRLPNAIGRLVTLSVRSFAGAPSRRKAGGAPLWGLYSRAVTALSTVARANFPATPHCGIRLAPSAHWRSYRLGVPHSRHIPPAFFASG